MDVVVDIECGSKDLHTYIIRSRSCPAPFHARGKKRGLGTRLFVRMDSLHDELSKLTSEKRKRQRKDDCLNLEKGLEQELLFLRGKRRSKAAPSSSVSSHCRVYTHDTSVRKGGTTKPKPRVHRKRIAPDPLETHSTSDTCKCNCSVPIAPGTRTFNTGKDVWDLSVSPLSGACLSVKHNQVPTFCQ